MNNVNHLLTNLVHNELICMYNNLKKTERKKKETITIIKNDTMGSSKSFFHGAAVFRSRGKCLGVFLQRHAL